MLRGGGSSIQAGDAGDGLLALFSSMMILGVLSSEGNEALLLFGGGDWVGVSNSILFVMGAFWGTVFSG